MILLALLGAHTSLSFDNKTKLLIYSCRVLWVPSPEKLNKECQATNTDIPASRSQLSTFTIASTALRYASNSVRRKTTHPDSYASRSAFENPNDAVYAIVASFFFVKAA